MRKGILNIIENLSVGVGIGVGVGVGVGDDYCWVVDDDRMIGDDPCDKHLDVQ